MSTTVAQVLLRTRGYMGIKLTDPEYPNSRLVPYVATAVEELRDECAGINEGLLVTDVTLSPDTDGGRVYTFGTQASPVGAAARVVSVQEADAEGVRLWPRDYAGLWRAAEPVFALLGAEGAQRIETGANVTAGSALYVRLILAPTLTAESDTLPAFIPDAFADVVALSAAFEAWPQGGEAQMPQQYLARLADRRDRLWDRWGFMTPGVGQRRDAGAGMAPELL